MMGNIRNMLKKFMNGFKVKEYKTIGSRSYFTNFLMKISYELYKTLLFILL